MQISWKNIRPLEGAQTEGFEEFCSQLSRKEPVPDGSQFTRKGKPDAGIECYWTLPSGEEWAWQAKYFLSLDTKQWAQIDESVKTALEKHPKLIRYHICVPLDLADARLDNQITAHQKWTERVKKWSGWASQREMFVEFVWWGSSEMIERLSESGNAGLARFWFDAAVLTPDWFERRLDEAIKTAGPRYTPEVNVELPIVQEFDAFGRTPTWIRRLKQHAASINKVARFASNETDRLHSQRADYKRLLEEFKVVVTRIREIEVEPTSPLSFSPIIELMEAAQNSIHLISRALRDSEDTTEQEPQHKTQTSYRGNPYRAARFLLHDVDRALGEAVATFQHTEYLAKSNLLILDGSAGMGKTHLLCDLAIRRQSQNRPSILLMGQRFLQPAEPWTQALQQMDLSRWTAEEFIGALEAVAKAADTKALLMIDALNEGAGRDIWPNNMSAFLGLATQSPWISIVISIRSNSEKMVLPEEVSKSASRVTHVGFEEHEYDASTTFFRFYGIELPSTPLLAPEYRSPLFLKSICVGLNSEGHTRLPRGFHGISQVFRLYIDAIDKRLAAALKFDPRSRLVQKVLRQLVSAFPSPQRQWLPREEAKALVDAFFPNQSFQNSLYLGLVTEGLLVEDFVRLDDGEHDFVHLGYERLADHFTAQMMLETARSHSAESADLSLLTHDVKQLSAGVLESLFVQTPETLQKELQDYAPAVLSHWRWAETFRQSLIWRSPTAFTEQTLLWFNESIQYEAEHIDALEVVLTLGSVPDHPWNADFLDRQLRRRKMPDRDVWWSIKLHSLYSERHSAVHRIINWALNVATTQVVDDESVRLVANVLAWMFSSSNRFLRDRATKAAANLLTGRETQAAQLIRTFGNIDDLYVRERVLAVAYGVAMRSNQASRIRTLAEAALETVFQNEDVVPHLLLRDYARGIVERLHSLEEQPVEMMQRVRPPYGSKWPRIPSKQTIERSVELAKEEGKDNWAARHIAFSVLHDDFGRYVIGTNSGATDWLSLRLTEPRWRSYDGRLQALRAKLKPTLEPAWEAYEEAESVHSRLTSLQFFAAFRRNGGIGDEDDVDTVEAELDPSLEQAKMEIKKARRGVLDLLPIDQAEELAAIWRSRRSSSRNRPPQFDLSLIQRYVVKRVFSMGWTGKRFEDFDSHVIRPNGREASKAERIGKKYQWIAYFEACALVADNFQFRNGLGLNAYESAYDGPWQDFFRDIDPSHSLLKTGVDSSPDVGWWSTRFEPDWGVNVEGAFWAADVSDFPDVVKLLNRRDLNNLSWLVADVSFNRSRPIPDGMNREDVESRTYWCHLRSFLVRNEDVQVFMTWAEGVDFFGQWMPEVPNSHTMFLGEYGWSAAWNHLDHSYYENDGWVQPGRGCPVPLRTSAFEYHQGSSGFDCSVDSGFTLHLPDKELLKAMNLRWSGNGTEFLDSAGNVVTNDPSVEASGPAALVIREDALTKMARDHRLSICWMIVGEKQAYMPGPLKHLGATHISGACTYVGDRIEGFVNFIKDDAKQDAPIGTILATKRYGTRR